MDGLFTIFPISGVETWLFLPPLVAFVISSFTSMAGISGAFMLLPFQMSVLGFTSPAVSSTNFVYNIVSIPSGVYRYFREGRMVWPLAWVIIGGSIPGVLVGYYVRILYLPDPRAFKVFVGAVLLYIGGKLLGEGFKRGKPSGIERNDLDRRLAAETSSSIKTISTTLIFMEYEFLGERYRFSVPALFALALLVGVIGGTYGIGGGAIIAPVCVTVFRLPVYTVAGAALLGTFVTSIMGVLFYSVLPAGGEASPAPDWALGFLFGIGGFAGMYIGARLQKFVPQKYIKLLLGILILSVAAKYIIQYFF